MAIYKCNSCGAVMDTDVATKSLGYSAGTKISFMLSKCGNCGSTDISEIKEYDNKLGIKVAFGDDLANVLLQKETSCTYCGKIFTFERGANCARSFGINDKVLMCSRCRKIYVIDINPSSLKLIEDVTTKYIKLEIPSPFNALAKVTLFLSFIPSLVLSFIFIPLHRIGFIAAMNPGLIKLLLGLILYVLLALIPAFILTAIVVGIRIISLIILGSKRYTLW
ncbi:MAG: hypothetical protein JXB50_05365 [Spirochaetes bacterium]|nr:hypothetical protein [Spirochaetota bacterium]